MCITFLLQLPNQCSRNTLIHFLLYGHIGTYLIYIGRTERNFNVRIREQLRA